MPCPSHGHADCRPSTWCCDIDYLLSLLAVCRSEACGTDRQTPARLVSIHEYCPPHIDRRCEADCQGESMGIFPSMETKRLILREYEPADAGSEDTFAYLSSPEVCRLSSYELLTGDQAAAYVASLLRRQEETPRTCILFIITLKSASKIIGECGIGSLSTERCSAEIACRLGESYWGNGYGPEATSALLEFGFRTLGLHRMHALCDTRNGASARGLEKAGMIREGVLREHLLQKGEWRSSFVYSILQHEYSGGRFPESQEIW